jgi:hypothetical protein
MCFYQNRDISAYQLKECMVHEVGQVYMYSFWMVMLNCARYAWWLSQFFSMFVIAYWTSKMLGPPVLLFLEC